MSDPTDDEERSLPTPTPDADPSPLDETTPADAEASEEGDGATVPLSDSDIRDALPDDLDAAGYVGPYLFPNNNRRRIPAYLYWAMSAVCVGVWLLRRDDDPVFINQGMVIAAVVLAVIGLYSFMAGKDLEVDEREALVAATRQVGFPVGHASAQMGWRGVLSRPTWRILLYSAHDPPEKRGLVLVDGVDGSIVEWFVEANPEDWSELSS